MQRFLLPLFALTAIVTSTAAAASPKTSEISALVADAKKCKFGQEGFDRPCEALKTWESKDELFDDGKGDDALLSMLASTDAKDRYLAADRLITLSGTMLSAEHARDPAIVDKILAVAQNERELPVAKRLADVVAHLDLTGTDRLGRAVDIAKNHRLEEYRREFARVAGFLSHSRGEALLAWGEELSSNGNHEPARYVISRHTRDTNLAARACKDLSTLRSDPSLGASVMMDLAAAPSCRSFHPAIVKDIAAMTLDKTTQTTAIALRSICSDPDTTAPLKTKALAQAKRIADSKNVPSTVRGSALTAVTSCDAKPVAVLASKSVKEKDKGPAPKSSRAAKK